MPQFTLKTQKMPFVGNESGTNKRYDESPYPQKKSNNMQTKQRIKKLTPVRSYG